MTRYALHAMSEPPAVQLVDELLVECPQRPGGCNQTVQRQLLAAHIKNACQFVHVPCPEGDCDQMVLRKDVGKHANDCVNRLVKCEGCGSSIKYTDQEVSDKTFNDPSLIALDYPIVGPRVGVCC